MFHKGGQSQFHGPVFCNKISRLIFVYRFQIFAIRSIIILIQFPIIKHNVLLNNVSINQRIISPCGGARIETTIFDHTIFAELPGFPAIGTDQMARTTIMGLHYIQIK